MPVRTPPARPETLSSNLLSGIAGGLVVLAIGGTLLGTGLINTGDTRREVVQQVPSAASTDTSVRPGRGGLSVAEIYRRAAPGVVFIRARIVTAQTDSPFGVPLEQEGLATGSGLVLDKSGDILTNAHVVEGAKTVQVRFEEDSDFVDADVVGRDLSTDIAVLKVDLKSAKLHPLPLGDSNRVRVGDPVIAIGNPFGYDRTVTTGIISALQRKITAPNGFQIMHVIQTDAPINPGNSGGPLLDAAGRVIGINSQIATAGSQGSVGIGFAVPIDTAKRIVPQLEKGGRVLRAYLGVTTYPLSKDLAAALNLPVDRGALVQDIVPGGPADKAGLKPGTVQTDQGIVLGGDIIVEVDGQKIEKPDDVATAINDNKPGDVIDLKFYRGGKLQTKQVKLLTRPASLENQGTSTAPDTTPLP